MQWNMCSADKEYMNPYAPMISLRIFRNRGLAVLILILLATALPALDITLNGVNLAVLEDSVLSAHARPMADFGGAPGFPLGTVYPWLESVEYLEAQSGPNRVFWEASRLRGSDWENALLVNRGGTWEIHVGRDVFSAPDRIAVVGKRLDVREIRISSTLEVPAFKSDIHSALAFKNVEIVWRDTSGPHTILGEAGSGESPHIVILNHFDAISVSQALSTTIPIGAKASRWFALEAVDSPYDEIPLPVAMDAYHPEAALSYLLSGPEPLFEENGSINSALQGFFLWASAARASGDLLVSENPVSDLASGDAVIALSLSSSKEMKPFISHAGSDILAVPPPAGLKNLAGSSVAAVPASLRGKDAHIARLLMLEIRRFGGIDSLAAEDWLIPSDPRIPDFYKAYERVGRLAISGQMEADEAVQLINEILLKPETEMDQ